jgi:hypothetical protein
MDPLRLIVLTLVVGLVVAGTAAYRRSRRLDAATTTLGLPALPASFVAGAPATWVIFTTPLCVSCVAVEAELRQAHPDDNVFLVDATEQPDLADAYRVRRAPTVVRADREGRVTARLVGVEGVRDHVGAGAAAG